MRGCGWSSRICGPPKSRLRSTTFTTAAPMRARQAVHDRDAVPTRVTGYRALPDAGTAQAAHAVAQLEVAQLREELRVADRKMTQVFAVSMVATGVAMFWLLPIWVALLLLLPGTRLTTFALFLILAGADLLGRAAMAQPAATRTVRAQIRPAATAGRLLDIHVRER